MNTKIIICAKAIIYLLLYNMHNCTFKDSIFLKNLFMVLKYLNNKT